METPFFGKWNSAQTPRLFFEIYTVLLPTSKWKELLGEKGKVRIVVSVIFSIVDQLLTRSLGLEKLPINNKTLILFLQISCCKIPNDQSLCFDLIFPFAPKAQKAK